MDRIEKVEEGRIILNMGLAGLKKLKRKTILNVGGQALKKLKRGG